MTGRNVDIAIVGGGIAGCATAYYLARRGLKVALVEKGEIAGEQSGRNWGFVRQQGRDPHEIPLMVACNRLWQGLSAELEADIEWRQGGLLYLAEDEARAAQYEAWLAHARAYQLDSRLLTGAEAKALLPALAGNWAAALHTPSDGQADPVKTTRAFAAAAERLGAEIHSGRIVETVETQGGAVCGVRTESGTIQADRVLLATGVWTSRFLRTLGRDLPQLYTRATVLLTTPTAAVTPLGVWCRRIGLRQRRNGAFNVAPGRSSDYYVSADTLRYLRAFWPRYMAERKDVSLMVGAETLDSVIFMLRGRSALLRRMRRDRVLAPEPNRRAVERAFAAFQALLPAANGAEIDTAWAGMIEATPDELPVLDSVPGIPGLFVATGFSGHGFGMGPIAGRLMAELIADGRPSLDLQAFRFSRFAERESRASNAV